MKIQCQQCTTKFKVPSKYYGKRIKCPKCKGPIEVPAAAASQPEGTGFSAPIAAPAPSDKIKIACQNCEASLKVPPKLIGKKVACPRCKTPIAVSAPAPSQPTVSQANAPVASAPVAAPTLTPDPTPDPAPTPTAAPSEKIKIACEHCKASLKVPPTLIGKTIPCPRCKQSIELTPADPTPETTIGKTELPISESPAAQSPASLVAPTAAPLVDNETAEQAEAWVPANQQFDDEEESDESWESSDDYVDDEEDFDSPRESYERKRRSKKQGTGSKVMAVISGMIVGLGTLFVAAALFVYFFGVPGQTVAALEDPEESKTKSVAHGMDLSTKFADPELDSAPSESLTNSSTDLQPPDPLSTPLSQGDPIVIAEVKSREALAPTLKMFTGETKSEAPSFNSLGFELTAKSEYAKSDKLKTLPEPLHYYGKVFVNSKTSTGISIDNSAQQKSFYPPETFATCIRLPEGIFLLPLEAIQYADFITVYDGIEKHDVKHVRLLKKGGFRFVVSLKRPDFPRVIASNTGELNGDTKGVTLIWVDRNSEIHVLENLDATGYDEKTTDVTFELPNDSLGGAIVNSSGQIAGLVSDVQNGTGTVTQISAILSRIRETGDELFDFARMPVAEDQAGKIREASACVAQLACKRNQLSTHAAFRSNIETQRGDDESSKQLFADRYDVNFKDSGQINHLSMYEGKGCRLPGFLGPPGTAAIIEFSDKPDDTEWKIVKNLSLGPTGNDRILVKDSRNTNELNHVVQTDNYRVVEETEDHLIIERDYLAKSALTEPKEGSLQWDIPTGFPFHVKGKFTYRYDKSLKLATSVKFEGVEQKQLTKDLAVPLNLSFQMTSIPAEEIDESQLPWKSE